MAQDSRKAYQLIVSTAIAAAGNVFESSELNVDKRYKNVTGYAVTIEGDETGINNSVFNRFEIDALEVFPANWDAQLIMVNRDLDVPPDEKFYSNLDLNGVPLVLPGNNSNVAIRYTDGGFAAVVYPYTLKIWLRLENPQEEEQENQMAEFMRYQKESFEAWKAEQQKSK